MPEWAVEYSQLSDIGRVRRNNEDFVDCFLPHSASLLTSHGCMAVLADGVGGAAAGEIASEYAVKCALHEYYRSNSGSPGRRLRRAVEAVNAAIFAHNAQRRDHRDMATTLVAAVIRGARVFVANVGDSRAYLVDDSAIVQITRDHSLVAEMIDEGSITKEQALIHPYRNVILRSLGPHASVRIDVFCRRIKPRQTLLLCSDGLTRQVKDAEIAEIVTTNTVVEAGKQLVQLANDRGGGDNTSVSITRILESQRKSDPGIDEQLPCCPSWDDY
jgi:PPM family protein phosphatase